MKIFKSIINIVLTLIIVICAYKIIHQLKEYNDADKVYNLIREEKEESDNLFEKNINYRGWIKIDNTNINYPILQGQDNEEYLYKDINNEYIVSGSIFMNYLNNGFDDQNTVLFGHNMKNGTMFANLKKYKEEDFFYNNNYIEIELSNGQYLKYKVFSVYITDINDNYTKTSFEDKDEYKEFLERIKNKSIYKSDISVNENDKIITLSTCSYEFDDARLVVTGKLIDKEQ
ncbi:MULTISPECIES: class B sortase [Clostridium]|uniref:class B sortase n=2 Tax=Clostridiaceae TaxID=31979 RepID=UPI00082092B3|nr:class B sortase [Clostridium saudiense]MDU7454095.1 class B sortase [Clostridium saudiense]SCJ97747.1 Sortase (surface protein transpeptidase) [uncultured Clostridium sp.]